MFSSGRSAFVLVGGILLTRLQLIDADITKILLDAVLVTTITKEDTGSDALKSPCNALEFGDMFAPYEEKMESIISFLT